MNQRREALARKWKMATRTMAGSSATNKVVKGSSTVAVPNPVTAAMAEAKRAMAKKDEAAIIPMENPEATVRLITL
jgi:hypothetical protein